MGVQLEKIFEIVEKKGGSNSRMELAEKIKLSKNRAKEIQDDDKVVSIVKKVASEIMGEDIENLLK